MALPQSPAVPMEDTVSKAGHGPQITKRNSSYRFISGTMSRTMSIWTLKRSVDEQTSASLPKLMPPPGSPPEWTSGGWLIRLETIQNKASVLWSTITHVLPLKGLVSRSVSELDIAPGSSWV